ncbi:MAG: HAD family hydrolase [Rhizobiaceae bacterium]|nr:HAD family hydrolase [Rhizobiaceae bacterium]
MNRERGAALADDHVTIAIRDTMAQQRVDLVIFDCDGVLIDSEILSAQTLIGLLADLGITIDLDHVQKHFLGRSFPTVAALIREQFSTVLPQGFEQTYRSELLVRFEEGLLPTPGIEQVLTELAVPACVATSSSPERANKSMQISGLARYFDQKIYTASLVARGKPAPDLFLHVAKCEGVLPQNCLVIEDSQPGLEAARAAGMIVWHYRGASHLKSTQPVAFRARDAHVQFDSWNGFFDLMPALKRAQILR